MLLAKPFEKTNGPVFQNAVKDLPERSEGFSTPQ
jgi:hypothetical protein